MKTYERLWKHENLKSAKVSSKKKKLLRTKKSIETSDEKSAEFLKSF